MARSGRAAAPGRGAGPQVTVRGWRAELSGGSLTGRTGWPRPGASWPARSPCTRPSPSATPRSSPPASVPWEACRCRWKTAPGCSTPGALSRPRPPPARPLRRPPGGPRPGASCRPGPVAHVPGLVPGGGVLVMAQVLGEPLIQGGSPGPSWSAASAARPARSATDPARGPGLPAPPPPAAQQSAPASPSSVSLRLVSA